MDFTLVFWCGLLMTSAVVMAGIRRRSQKPISVRLRRAHQRRLY